MENIGFQSELSASVHQFWRTAPAEQYLTFDLQTCGAVTLMLTFNLEVITTSSFHAVCIDFNQDTSPVAYLCMQPSQLDLLTNDSSELVPSEPCGDNYQTYWASWIDGSVKAGVFSEEEHLVTGYDSGMLDTPVNFVVFTSKSGGNTNWTLQGYQSE